jgi:uncharacterized protein DUF5677
MLKAADKYDDPSDTEIADLIKSLTPSPAALEPWRNWWDKNKTIYDLAQSLGMEQQYVANYALLSAFIHSAPVGTSFYLFGTGDTVNVDWKANRPSPQ